MYTYICSLLLYPPFHFLGGRKQTSSQVPGDNNLITIQNSPLSVFIVSCSVFIFIHVACMNVSFVIFPFCFISVYAYDSKSIAGVPMGRGASGPLYY